jgi:hypothetical protein
LEVHVLPEHFVPVVDAGVTEPDDETSRQREFAQPEHIARVFAARVEGDVGLTWGVATEFGVVSWRIVLLGDDSDVATVGAEREQESLDFGGRLYRVNVFILGFGVEIDRLRGEDPSSS